jgi:hypothetical protein
MSVREDGLYLKGKGTFMGASNSLCAGFSPFFVGCSVPSVVRPRPVLGGLINSAGGTIHRVGRKMPVRNPALSKRFLAFSKLFFKKFLKPLDPLVDLSVDTWLEKTNYTEAEKNKFRELDQSFSGLRERDFCCDSFIKCESYGEYKYPRPINSHSDKMKVTIGPLIKAMEEATYYLPFFVKHEDVCDRPKNLFALFGEDPVSETDFTSMEAHHEGVFAEFCILWMGFLLRNLPDRNIWLNLLKATVRGTNKMSFKTLFCILKERLMTGAMWTSIINALLNLVLMHFLFLDKKFPLKTVEFLIDKTDDFKIRIEGDDGIMSQFEPDPATVGGLGLLIKMDHAPNFGEASFCGIVADIATLQNTADPYKIMADFGLVDPKYAAARVSTKLALARAKAMSFICAYPACPVVSELARMVIRLTPHIDVRKVIMAMGTYDKERFLKASRAFKQDKNLPISMSTRRIVERKFKMAVETQILIEEQFRSCNQIGPLNPVCEFPSLWMDHARKYVSPFTEEDLFVRHLDPEIASLARGEEVGEKMKTRERHFNHEFLDATNAHLFNLRQRSD